MVITTVRKGTFSVIKLFVYTLTLTIFLLLTACGEDTSAPTRLSPLPHTVTVTFGLQGSSATTVSGVDLDVLLPPGFVLETDNLGDPTDNALKFLVDNDEDQVFADANYKEENRTIKAVITKTYGFAADADLMQISCIYPANTILPTLESFSVTAVANDLTPTPRSDISYGIRIDIQLTP